VKSGFRPGRRHRLNPL